MVGLLPHVQVDLVDQIHLRHPMIVEDIGDKTQSSSLAPNERAGNQPLQSVYTPDSRTGDSPIPLTGTRISSRPGACLCGWGEARLVMAGLDGR